MSDVDELIMWVDEMRERNFGVDGEKIFNNAALVMSTDKPSGSNLSNSSVSEIARPILTDSLAAGTSATYDPPLTSQSTIPGTQNIAAKKLFSRRLRSQKRKQNTMDTIDVDIYQPSKRQRRQPKVWLDPLNLLQKDRDILLSPTGWVTDSIINAAEQLLRQRFPQLPGLQDVALGQTMAFTIMTGRLADDECSGRSVRDECLLWDMSHALIINLLVHGLLHLESHSILM